MKSLFLLLFFPYLAIAQLINTIPGTTGSLVNQPEGLAIDGFSNLYIADGQGCKILKIDSLGGISLFAGTGIAGFSGDFGPASTAQLNIPNEIATDHLGNLYIADCVNNRIRKVNLATSIIQTIAGNDSAGFWGDGSPSFASLLYHPTGICIDKYNNIYICDSGNKRIRKIDTNNIITTIAGNGLVGSTGNGGPATSAKITPLYNLCVNKTGCVFFGDNGNSTVRKIDENGIISIFAGDSLGSGAYVSDEVKAIGAPMTPCFIGFSNNGLMYICDTHNNRIRKIDSLGYIHTIAGNGIYGNSGDYGLATESSIGFPEGFVFDFCNNIYISQISFP